MLAAPSQGWPLLQQSLVGGEIEHEKPPCVCWHTFGVRGPNVTHPPQTPKHGTMGAKYKAYERRRKLFGLLQLLLLFPALLFAMVGYGTPWWFQIHMKAQLKEQPSSTGAPVDLQARLFQFNLASAPQGNETGCPGTNVMRFSGANAVYVLPRTRLRFQLRAPPRLRLSHRD